MMTATLELTRKEYELFRQLVYRECGISLGDEKMQLVKARLSKRIRQSEFKSFREYYDHVVNDETGEELSLLLDAISTNTTHLFREAEHFKVLRDIIDKWGDSPAQRADANTLRIWSAACSSGEEPYSIAMVAHQALQQFPNTALKILATDISTRMLAKAKQGIYQPNSLEDVPDDLRRKYFKPVQVSYEPSFQIAPEIRKTVTFARFNLMTPSFPFHKGFDVIFCRNVMIYFDRTTQGTLVNKFAGKLHPGGYLMIGHSESLNSISHPLTYLQPTVYRKK